MTHPLPGLSLVVGVTVDNVRDVFVSDYYRRDVVELPWAGTDYGSQVTLPFSSDIVDLDQMVCRLVALEWKSPDALLLSPEQVLKAS